MLAAVSTLISTCETRRDAEWETLSELARQLDKLELRLGERDSAESSDDAFLKKALKEVETALQNFARRRTLATTAGELTAPRKSSLESPSRAGVPFGSDLLSRLNAAIPGPVSAPTEGRNDLAELARKLDDMCSGASSSGASRARGNEPETDAPAGRASPTNGSRRDVDAAIAFNRRAGHAQERTEKSNRVAIIETSTEKVETDAFDAKASAASGAGSKAVARAQDEMAELRDLVVGSAVRPAPIERIAQWVEPSAKISASGDRDEAPHEGGCEPGREIPAPPSDLDDGRHDALLERIEAAHRQFTARIEAGLVAASAETSALKNMVGALSEKMEAVQNLKPADLAFEALEREMAKIAERLDSADKAFASLTAFEPSIAALFEQLEQTRRMAIEAVAAAERSGAPNSARGAELGDSSACNATVEPSVIAEIAELRAAQEAADRRVDLTLSALRETVDKVADRLFKVEGDVGAMRPARLGSLLAPNLTPIFSPRAESYSDEPVAIKAAGSNPAKPAGSLPPPAKLSFETKPVVDPRSVDASDVLLEPGSGAPQRRERTAPARLSTPPAIANIFESSPAGRADFIAAARRAAQATQTDSFEAAPSRRDAEADAGRTPPPGLLSRTRRFFRAHKGPVILSLAALLLAATAYALARKVVHIATVDDFAPALLKRLESGLVHKKAEPAAADKAAASDLRSPANPTAARTQALPGLLDSSEFWPPQSPANPQIQPDQSSREEHARRTIAGSAPIVAGAFDQSVDRRLIAMAPHRRSPQLSRPSLRARRRTQASAPRRAMRRRNSS